MAANRAKLEENGNMPPGFPREVEEAETAFLASRTAFTAAEQASIAGTSAREAANLDILKELNPMLSFGKIIFEDDQENKNHFTYDELLDQVRGDHPAGVKGFAREGVKKLPVPGVLVRVRDEGKSATTDDEGKYDVNLAAGTYTVEFSKAGYETQVVENKVVKIGTKHRLSVLMVKLPVEAAPALPAPPQPEALRSNGVQAPANGVEAVAT